MKTKCKSSKYFLFEIEAELINCVIIRYRKLKLHLKETARKNKNKKKDNIF